MKSTTTGAKPDLAAQNTASTTPYPVVVERLIEILGAQIVAHIGGVKDARTVAAWARGEGSMPHDAARREQIAYACALTLRDRYDTPRVAAWFTWLNDLLDDASPAAFLRSAKTDDDIEKKGLRVLQAARRELAE